MFKVKEEGKLEDAEVRDLSTRIFRRVRFLSVPKLDSRLCPTVFRRMYGALLRVFLVAVHPADLLVAPMYAHVMEFSRKMAAALSTIS